MKFFFTIFFLNLWLASGFSQVATQLPPEELRRLPQEQIWFTTDNAVALRDTAINRTEVLLMTLSERGAYRLPHTPSGTQAVRMNAESYHQVGRFSLYGKMKYDVGGMDELKWKYDLLIAPRNPFVLADSIGGHYDIENFGFEAGIAGSLAGGTFDYGVRTSYRTCSSAKNKDPRPLINGTRYAIRPGISYRWNWWRMGLSMLAEGYEEDVSVRVLERMKTQQYFLFMGLGYAHRELGTDFSRESKGIRFGGSLQAGYETQRLQQLLDVAYVAINEGGTLGSAIKPFKTGDYSAGEIVLRYMLKHKYNSVRANGLLHVSLSRYDDQGLWYEQKLDPVKIDPPEWIVINKSIKWMKQTDEWLIGYQFMRGLPHRRDYTLGLTTVFYQTHEQAYPNNEEMTFQQLTLRANADKAFYFGGRNKLLVDARLDWRKTLWQQADFKDVQLKSNISYPVAHFLASDYLHSKFSITFARSYQLIQNYALAPYLKASFAYQQPINAPNGYTNTNRIRYEFVFGLIF